MYWFNYLIRFIVLYGKKLFYNKTYLRLLLDAYA